MELKLSKSQKKGIVGKPVFMIQPELVLSAEERELVKHYGLEEQVLTSKKLVGLFGSALEGDAMVTVGQLLRGDSFKCKSLEEVISYRTKLIEACKNLKIFLEVARTFGGVEAIDIDALLDDGQDDDVEENS